MTCGCNRGHKPGRGPVPPPPDHMMPGRPTCARPTGPSEYIPSHTYPDVLGMFPGPCCCPPPPPFPPPQPEPEPPCPCPPKIYRNPPDVELVEGDNVILDKTVVDEKVTYKVSAVIPSAMHYDVEPGENTEVTKVVDGNTTTFTVDAVIPEAMEYEVAAGENTEVTKVVDGNITTFTVDAVIPENPVMRGATAESDGVEGLVPAPVSGEQGHVLEGSGNWVGIRPMGIDEIDELLGWSRV